MRILAINTVPTERNGITNVIFNLYEAMDMQGFVVDYVAIREPEPVYAERIRQWGGQVFVVPREIRRPFSYLRKLEALIRKGKYDVIHAHGNSATLALEMLAARMAGCSIRIAHCHNTTCRFVMLHKLLLPVFRSSCTHALACGTAAGRWLYGGNSFAVVNNGVNTERYAFQEKARRNLREKYQIGNEEILIGHVGVFNEAKNQSFLTDILAELRAQEDKYRLMLIGDGALRPSVEEKAVRLGLQERIIFVGETDQVAAYLCACDLMVMPSLFEGLPLSLIEAQANGLQCVVSENITREVDKTGNITFVPLEGGAGQWAQVIREIPQQNDRAECSDKAVRDIRNCGYDIAQNSADLRRYYQRIVE